MYDYDDTIMFVPQTIMLFFFGSTKVYFRLKFLDLRRIYIYIYIIYVAIVSSDLRKIAFKSLPIKIPKNSLS